MKTFVVGSGRSGTLTMSKVFGMYADSRHEHMCTEVERLGTLLYYGKVTPSEVTSKLRDWFADGQVHVNNKLSWVFPELIEAFPDAKFILLTRDGRKVVSSYFNKLGDEAYTSLGVLAQKEFLNGGEEPFLKKGLWYPIPKSYGDGVLSAGIRFILLSWYWGFANSYVRTWKDVYDINFSSVKFEDIISYPSVLGEVVNSVTGRDVDEMAYNFIQRPHNVIVPVDYGLTALQEKTFFGVKVARDSMRTLGYTKKETYSVKY